MMNQGIAALILILRLIPITITFLAHTIIESVTATQLFSGLPVRDTCTELSQEGTSLTEECVEAGTSSEYACHSSWAQETAECDANKEMTFDNCTGTGI